MLSKAIAMAAQAHAGQVDKGGHPYILHPMRVMMNCEEETAKICAALHDVLEDTDVTLEDLRAEGFSSDIISALDCLTRREGEAYDDYIGRILQNEIACVVKLADLADNMDLIRIKNPSAADIARMKKYQETADLISDSLPFADPIPNCRLIEINGIAEIHPVISHAQFLDIFIRFIESHGWFFGGGVNDITDKEVVD